MKNIAFSRRYRTPDSLIGVRTTFYVAARVSAAVELRHPLRRSPGIHPPGSVGTRRTARLSAVGSAATTGTSCGWGRRRCRGGAPSTTRPGRTTPRGREPQAQIRRPRRHGRYSLDGTASQSTRGRVDASEALVPFDVTDQCASTQRRLPTIPDDRHPAPPSTRIMLPKRWLVRCLARSAARSRSSSIARMLFRSFLSDSDRSRNRRSRSHRAAAGLQ